VEAASLEAAAAASQDNTDPGRKALQTLFRSFMISSSEDVAQHLTHLITRLSSKDWSMLTPTEAIVLRCNEQFPGDIGCFCPFLLNYIKLNPGEAIFLAANEPHAYLSGDLAECMACSDNVIRSGLTPKFKDVDLLCECLTYSTGRAPVDYGRKLDQCTTLYTPPVPEFEMMRINLSANSVYTLKQAKTPMLMVIIEGAGTVQGKACTKGQVYFVSPGFDVALTSADDAEMLIYAAHCNESSSIFQQ